MINTFKKIFNFAGNKKDLLKKSIAFSIINSIFDMFQIFALVIVLNDLIKGIEENSIWYSLGIMLISVVGKIVTGYISDFD